MKDRLKEVLKIQSESYGQWRMFAFLIRKIKAMPNTKLSVTRGNIYVTKSVNPDQRIFPCVVAHMDTVHKIVEDLTLLTVGDNITGFNTITMTQTGIGGDDKVGVFVALECLQRFDNIKVAFFRDEEVGCEGSEVAVMGFFDDCSMVLQCDRRGNSDVVTNASGTPLCSRKFKRAIRSIIHRHGYDFSDGMMTDVMTLKDNGLAVSALNISCGYYNPHSDNEYVSVSDVANCLSMVFEIIETHGHRKFPHEFRYTYVPPVYKGGSSFKGRDDWYTSYEGWPKYDRWSKWKDGLSDPSPREGRIEKQPGEKRWWEGDGQWDDDDSVNLNAKCGCCGTIFHRDDVEYFAALNTWLCKTDCLPFFKEELKHEVK